VSIGGSAQSTFERICAALEVPGLVSDPRFLDNRLRLKHAAALDVELQNAIERFDMKELLRRFMERDATVAPVNDVAQILEDEHIVARGDIVAIDDPELHGPLRMQNVVGRLSRTPGGIRNTGPKLGAHNREILVGQLGYSEEELRSKGIPLEPITLAADTVCDLT
jgi:crotonobetainyl-CoA:carnitine CoA-transferase CaiB-like acyl-CoA transferase